MYQTICVYMLLKKLI